MVEYQKKYWDNFDETLYHEIKKAKAEWLIKQQITYN